MHGIGDWARRTSLASKHSFSPLETSRKRSIVQYKEVTEFAAEAIFKDEKANHLDVGGSFVPTMTATSTLNVGDNVYVGLGTSPATITSLLPNDYAEIKWKDKAFEKNESVYQLSQLKLMKSRRLRSKPALLEKEQSAPAKKMKRDNGIKSNTSKDPAETSKEPSTKTVSPETAPTPERSASLTSIDDSNVKSRLKVPSLPNQRQPTTFQTCGK